MANNTLKTDAIKNELVRYIATQPKLMQLAVLSQDVLLNKYSRTITKVKGHYPNVSSLMSNVVQIFESKKFTPYGQISFLNKTLTNYHQKIDFELDPAEILGTWYESAYDESKGVKDKSISKLAIQMLQEKIIDDVNYLSIHGKYDASQRGSATPTFGTSMDGLNEVHKKLASNTDNPVFSIPGDAITSSNVVDVVTNFEKQLPSLMKSKVKTLFMSASDLENYQIAYEDRFGQNKFQDSATRTRLGKREIVGLPGLTQGTIVASVDGNLLKLIDEVDNPASISDIQVHDRILRVYGEFTLGYDYAYNPLVYMHTADGSKHRGLNNSELNKLIYPQEEF